MAKDNDKPPGKDTPSPYRHEDEIEHWKNEYMEVRHLIAKEMEDLSSSGHPAGIPPGSVHEKRAEPRYAFMEYSKIYAHIGPKGFPILNISIGGIAFHSDIPFDQGTKLLMSALGMIALEVEVLECVMEETDSDLLEFKYRIRASFGSHVNGYQVYVLAREMHLQNTRESGKTMEPHAGPKDE